MSTVNPIERNWRANPYLGDVESGRRNNLNLIRLVLASMVILSHSYVLLNRFRDEPMQRWLHFNDMGGTAVYSFFFLSGFLIYKSAMRTSPEEFLIARILRIFPGLAVVTILAIFVLGPTMTVFPLPQYFSASATWAYLSNAMLHLENATLPGLFDGRPDRVVNQPLWTLPSEWTMYIGMWLLGILWTTWRERKLPAKRALLIMAILLYTFSLRLPGLDWVPWFAFAALGAGAYVARRRIPLSISLAFCLIAACLIALLTVAPAGKALFPFALAYFLLVMGFHPALHIEWHHKLGDYSYGLYIYGWPVQQLAYGITMAPLVLFSIAFPIALAAAVCSWHLVEAPSLRLKNRLRRHPRAFGVLDPVELTKHTTILGSTADV